MGSALLSSSCRGLLPAARAEVCGEVLLGVQLGLRQLLGKRACQPGQLGQLEQHQQLGWGQAARGGPSALPAGRWVLGTSLGTVPWPLRPAVTPIKGLV